MYLQAIISSTKHALMITSFVLIMMLIIEYINVQTQGTWGRYIKKYNCLQIIISALLGILPGCLGTFTVVSLYIHGIVNFGALVSVMIATSGDEAFVMFATIPKTAVIINIILFITAIFSGYLVNFFFQKKIKIHGFVIHPEENHCKCFQKQKILSQLKNISFERLLLISSFLIFTFLLIIGEIGEGIWDWKHITFLILSIITLFIVTTTPGHFIKEHLWEHILKRHLLKIFLWILVTLIFINIFENFLNIKEWIRANYIIILLIAVLIGIIPESGPHLIFITLFVNGSIPFSVLLANSIVQDGHGTLPLLADSKKSFVYVKLINLIIGFVLGFLTHYLFYL